MQFLVPAFLFAGLAIAVPILIHLFYFRRFKQVYFTNVRFLREIREEKAARSRLRNLLVLAARILAILAIVAAFAQPFLPRGAAAAAGPKAVGIFIDNSFSMQALSRDVSLLEMARLKARQIIEGYGAADRFHIMTNDAGGGSTRLLDKEEALAAVDDIRVSPAVLPLSRVLARQQRLLAADADRQAVSYLISDFQRTEDALAPWQDTTMAVHAVLLQAVREQNVSIDSVWLEGPVLMARQPNKLIVRLRNHGDNPAEQVRLAIREGGQEKPVGNVQIPARSTWHDTVVYTPQTAGWQDLELFIQDYPIQFDDRYFAAAEVLERLSVLVIHDVNPSPYLQRGLQGLPSLQTEYQSAARLAFDQFGRFPLLVLDGLPDISSGLRNELLQYMKNGGNLLVFPPAAKTALPGYSELLSEAGARGLGKWQESLREVGQLNTASFVFQDVYLNAGPNLTLPVTRGHYDWTNPGRTAEEALLLYRDGGTALGRYRQEAGNLYLSAAPLDERFNDLGRSGEVFIPMLYKMALSGNQARALGITIGVDDEWRQTLTGIRNAEEPLRLRSDDYEFVPYQRFVGPELRLGIPDDVPRAGVYALQASGDNRLGLLGLNFDRRESVQDFLDGPSLQALGFAVPDAAALADLTVWIGELEQGVVLWRWFVILALVFLAVEMLLLRFWKT